MGRRDAHHGHGALHPGTRRGRLLLGQGGMEGQHLRVLRPGGDGDVPADGRLPLDDAGLQHRRRFDLQRHRHGLRLHLRRHEQARRGGQGLDGRPSGPGRVRRGLRHGRAGLQRVASVHLPDLGRHVGDGRVLAEDRRDLHRHGRQRQRVRQRREVRVRRRNLRSFFGDAVLREGPPLRARGRRGRRHLAAVGDDRLRTAGELRKPGRTRQARRQHADAFRREFVRGADHRLERHAFRRRRRFAPQL